MNKRFKGIVSLKDAYNKALKCKTHNGVQVNAIKKEDLEEILEELDLIDDFSIEENTENVENIDNEQFVFIKDIELLCEEFVIKKENKKSHQIIDDEDDIFNLKDLELSFASN